MTPIDFIIVLLIVLFVVYLIVVAATEPRYTWNPARTLADAMLDLQDSLENLRRAIGERLIPVFQDTARSFDGLSEAASKFMEGLEDAERQD